VKEKLCLRVINNQTTAVVLVDAQLRIEFINSAAEALLSTSNTRSIGLPMTQVVRLSDCEYSNLRSALGSGQPYTQRRQKLLNANGPSVTVDYTVTPISSDEKPFLVFEIFPRDRWLRISREETLMEQQETSRTLVRGFAHEVKNPLGGIRGAAQLLQRELHDPQLEEYTNVIIAEADRLRNLVNQMLGPYTAPKIEPMNIHEVLERVYSLITSETGGKIEIIRDYDPSIPEFPANKEALIQATLNIARNAMQALLNSSVKKPHIRFKTRSARQLTLGNQRHKIVCRVDIEDNGPGIPEQIKETIFLPMVSGGAGGSGLGLTISQRIVHQHNGLIEYESQPGHTCFTLYLPIQLNEEHHGV